jgi:transcriptional regulator with XRE-family HTH domain
MFRRGLVQDDVARMFGVHQSTVSGWVSGSSLPHPSRAQALAEFMGVPRADVLGWMADDVERRRVSASTAAATMPEPESGTLRHPNPGRKTRSSQRSPSDVPAEPDPWRATIEQRLSDLESVVAGLADVGLVGRRVPSSLTPAVFPPRSQPKLSPAPEELPQS